MFSSPFSGTETARSIGQTSRIARACGASRKTPLRVLLSCSLAALASNSPEASAQLGASPDAPARYPRPCYVPFTQIIGGAVGASNAITSVIGTMNTAFLAQGNAFVAGLPNAQPDQVAGGIWARMIGGRAR